MNKIKATILELTNVFFQKYWPDPVWSKVISVVIITIGGSILTFIAVLAKSLYDQVSFTSVAKQVINYFTLTTEVNNFIILLSLLVISWTVFSFLKIFLIEIKNKIKRTSKIEITEPLKELPIITENSTSFFSYRLARAFPGQRGLKWYDSKTSVERFKILFQEPLKFKSSGIYECVTDPIWWFRGGRSMFINQFKVLSKTKILLGWDELEIKRIAVNISDSYYKCFIYVEAKGEKQTGLYNYTAKDISRHVDSYGFSSEEYGLLGNTPIRREQYDDGATIIKGKVVDATSAELRTRFLTDYNFIICAKQAPYNSSKFNRESNIYFDNILKGTQTPESFFSFLDEFERREL